MKPIVILFLTLCFLRASGQPKELISKAGLVISYEAQKLETDKKSDKWKITVTVDNGTGADLYFTGSLTGPNASVTFSSTYARIDITNSKGLLSIPVKFFRGQQAADVKAADGKSVFRIKSGATVESFNTSVAIDATPHVTGSISVDLLSLAEVTGATVTQQKPPASSLPVKATTVPANDQVIVVVMPEEGRTFITYAAANLSDSYEEGTIAYVNWDNKEMGVAYQDGKFTVAEGGDFAKTSQAAEIQYLDLNRAKMTLRVADDEQTLITAPSGNFNLKKEHLTFEHIGYMGKKLETGLKPVITPMLKSGKKLKATMSLTTTDFRFSVLMQGDGNLVAFNNDGHKQLWASNTVNKSVGYAEMQPDGDFVLKTAAGVPVWSTRTQGNPGAYALLGDDGKFTIVTTAGAVLWTMN